MIGRDLIARSFRLSTTRVRFRYGDAAGHSCMAVAGAETNVITVETGSNERLSNMHAFAAAALNLLLKELER